VTREAAKALGLENKKGTLEIGKDADIAIWDINHPNELTYWIGFNQLSNLIIKGKVI
jgi:imidazolonepropionase